MKKFINSIGLQEKLIEFTPEIKYNNIFLIKTFDELMQLLKHIDTKNYTLLLYLNKNEINDILYNEDKIVPIINECIDNNSLKSIFYLAAAINNNKFIINYSYDSSFIKKVYSWIENEKNALKKYILSILFDSILDNYQDLSKTEDSTSSDELTKFSEEIKNNIKTPKEIFDEFKINISQKISENQEDISKIENIYNKIIIFLIQNKKFDDYGYAKNILEQLDLENIELTYKMYEAIKKLFDENYKKDYIDNYKIKNIDDLFNEKIANFYTILFKYILKNSIYIYNINFLLDVKKSILEILDKDYITITNALKIKTSEKEKDNLNFKIKIILKTFLDSEYYTSKNIFALLEEILKYFKNFYFKSKEKEINEINQILSLKNKEGCIKYIQLYAEAKKQNKRYNILKYIFDSKNKNFTEESFLKDVVNKWERQEISIKEKKSNIKKNKFWKEIFNYFNDEKNRDDILGIFKQDEIDSFIKNYNLITNLGIILTYYKNYLFESKQEEIKLLSKNNDNLEADKFLVDLEIAKIKNDLYDFISKVFKINNDTKTEKEVEFKLKEWENIKKMLEEEKYKFEDDDIKIGLFVYFNNEKNIETRNKILNEKGYKFLIKQRKEVEDVILNYYEIFLPKTKKDEIESIKNGKITDSNLMDYFKAKIMNLRKPIIFNLLDKEKTNNEEEIKKAKEKWEKIEKDINSKNFGNIGHNDRQKIIKFFQNKDDEKYTFIKKIFDIQTINEFLKFK